MSEWKTIESAPKDGTVTIPLTSGLVTIIDAADLAKVSKLKWHANPRRDRKGFYAVSTYGVRMHRLLMGVRGAQIVDHIDGNGLNNVRANLRIGTQSQNCVNRKTTPGRYLRGARPKKGRWQAYIKFNGKQRSLGYFETEPQAHSAYLIEAHSLHGNWMPLPKPPQGGGSEE